MKKVKDWSSFLIDDSRKKITENNSISEYSSSDLVKMMSEQINESNGFLTEKMIHDAHSVYELNLLYEKKSHWFEDSKELIYLESNGYVILFKNNEVHLIEEKTFKANESIFYVAEELDVFKPFKWLWGKAKQVGGSILGGLSKGAKLVYTWCKKSVSAVGVFLKKKWDDGTILDYGIPILSGLAVLIGWWTGAVPLGNMIGGAILVLGGIRHIVIGRKKLKKAKEYYKESGQITMDQANYLNKINQEATNWRESIPYWLGGWSCILIGVFDLMYGVKLAITGDPHSIHGSSSWSNWAHEISEKVLKIPPFAQIDMFKDWIGSFFKGMLYMADPFKGSEFFGSLSKEAAKTGGKAISISLIGIIGALLTPLLKKLFGSTYDDIVNFGADKYAESLRYLANIPSNLKKGMQDYCEKNDGFFAWIISGALKKIMNPLCSWLEGPCNALREYSDSIVKGMIERRDALKFIERVENEDPEALKILDRIDSSQLEKKDLDAARKDSIIISKTIDPVEGEEDDKNKLKEKMKKLDAGQVDDEDDEDDDSRRPDSDLDQTNSKKNESSNFSRKYLMSYQKFKDEGV